MNKRSIVPFVLASGTFLVLFLSTNLIYVIGVPTAEVKIPKGSSQEEDGNHFKPETLKIGKGTTVKWINEDSTLHTVTSGTPDGGESGTVFDSSYLAGDTTYKHTFKNIGTFEYYCTLHPYMMAKIVVSGSSTPEIKTAEKEPSVVVDTTPNPNINVSNWSNFTDSENRFSVQYPSHWSVTQSGNRFMKELPLVTTDATDATNSNATSSKVQSQLSVNVFKSSNDFNSNELAKFAFNQFVKQMKGNKLVEPISCNQYTVDALKACSFVYSGDDEQGERYGILDVVIVDSDKSNHIISYRADPLNFDKEKATIDHIIGSYKLLKNQK